MPVFDAGAVDSIRVLHQATFSIPLARLMASAARLHVRNAVRVPVEDARHLDERKAGGSQQTGSN